MYRLARLLTHQAAVLRWLFPHLGFGVLLAVLAALVTTIGGERSREASAAVVFHLPWQSGIRMAVLQGQQQGSHTGLYSQYAFDFAPNVTGDQPFTVRAARGGKIIEIQEDYPVSPDCQPSLSSKGNYVIIDHGDGLGSYYMHLAPKSVIPELGANVREGDVLGLTGKTGYVCGTTHLHFTVIELPSRKSVDVPFSDSDTLRDGGRPKTGRFYISANSAVGYTVTLPMMPRRSVVNKMPQQIANPPAAAPTASPTATPTVRPVVVPTPTPSGFEPPSGSGVAP